MCLEGGRDLLEDRLTCPRFSRPQCPSACEPADPSCILREDDALTGPGRFQAVLISFGLTGLPFSPASISFHTAPLIMDLSSERFPLTAEVAKRKVKTLQFVSDSFNLL